MNWEKIWHVMKDVKTLLVVVIITTMLAVLIPIRSARETGDKLKGQLAQLTEIAAVNRETNQRVRDCVLPEGRCYQANVENQDKYAEQLRRYEHAVNLCSAIVLREGQTDIRQTFDQCVRDELAKSGR